MFEEKKIFEYINANDDLRYIKPNEALNISNCRMAVSSDGKDKRIENILSTLLIPNTYLPTGNNTTIGSVSDPVKRRLIFFNYNSNGNHGIYCYDFNLSIYYTIILTSQVTGGLNFSLNNRIDRNAKVIGQLLIWTNNLNEPSCINIESAILANNPGYITTAQPYSFPISYESFTLIKRPPIFPLVTTLNSTSSTNNFIFNYAFQFCYYYEYKDYQVSALSAYSKLVGREIDNTYSNVVDLTIPFAEKIDDYVQKIYICVKYGNNGKTFIFRIFDKNNPSDLSAINAHNAGTTQLFYRFANDKNGIAVDNVLSVTPFDDVPLYVKTLELAKDRLFLANYISGYNTPLITSLTAKTVIVDTGTGGSYTGKWGYVTLEANLSGGQTAYNYPFLQLDTPLPNGNYLLYFPNARVNPAWDGGTYYPNDLKLTENLTDAQFQANSESNLVYQLKIFMYPTVSPGVTVLFPTWQSAYYISYNSFNINCTVTSYSPTQAINSFKTGGSYKISIAFYDRFRRKSGIVNQDISVTIPERTYSQTTFNSVIQWSLSNTNALNEIPIWAYYYQIHITQNQIQQSFIQAETNTAFYAVKKVDGTYDVTPTIYSKNQNAIALDISQLNNFGIGYTYNPGDICKLYLSTNTTPYYLNVIGTYGNYLLIQNINIGTLGTNVQILYEVYTPFISNSINTNYYETGNVYTIINPGTSLRSYSILSDNINGDVYLRQRAFSSTANYIAEAMSLNDNFWYFWDRDLGWINVVDNIGQQNKITSIKFSDTYISGTHVNGLNKFQPLNTQNVSSDSGQIQKLQLTNKLSQQIGNVMLCICQNTTLSIYLGETQLVSTNENAYVAQSTGVIGTINALRGTRGTMHPESVISYLAEVYFFDIVHGQWIQYSDNGLNPVNYLLDRYFKKAGQRYLQQNKTDRIISCIDPFRYHLMACMPSTELPTYPYTLPSYGGVVPSYATSISYPFDIYDGQSKTVFLDVISNQWKYNIGINPEWLDYFENRVYGFLNGNMYLYEGDTTYNTFFGQQLPARLAFTANQNIELRFYSTLNVSDVKELYNISLDSNLPPDYTVAYTDYPDEQITDLINSDYTSEEGLWYAPFYKDRLSPNVTGSTTNKMIQGDFLRSITPMILVEFQQYTQKLKISFVNIGHETSLGHTEMINK